MVRAGDDEGDGGLVGAPHKVLCRRWLDEVFTALHEDLQDHAELSAVDAAAASAPRGALSAAAAGISAGASTALGARAALCRAELALRLRRVGEARAAFTRAALLLEELLDGDSVPPAALTHFEQLWRSACHQLMSLCADAGAPALVEGLAAATRLLEASADARAARVDATPPREVSGFVFAAVAAHGLQAVRTAHKAVGGTPNFSLQKLFHEVVAWKTDGFDR